MQNQPAAAVQDNDEAAALLASCRRLAYVLDEATKSLTKDGTTPLPVDLAAVVNLASSAQALLFTLQTQAKARRAFYVYDPAQPFDRATAVRFDSLADAGVEILGHGQDYADLVSGSDDRLIPYHSKDGRPVYFTSLAAETSTAALANVARSNLFPLRCVDEAQAKAMEAAQANPSILSRIRRAVA